MYRMSWNFFFYKHGQKAGIHETELSFSRRLASSFGACLHYREPDFGGQILVMLIEYVWLLMEKDLEARVATDPKYTFQALE